MIKELQEEYNDYLKSEIHPIIGMKDFIKNQKEKIFLLEKEFFGKIEKQNYLEYFLQFISSLRYDVYITNEYKIIIKKGYHILECNKFFINIYELFILLESISSIEGQDKKTIEKIFFETYINF